MATLCGADWGGNRWDLLMRAAIFPYVLLSSLVGCSSLLDFDAVSFESSDGGGQSESAAGGTGGGNGSGASGGAPTGGAAGTGGGEETGGVGGTGGELVDASIESGTGGVAGASASGGAAGATGGSGGNSDPCATITCGVDEHCEPATLSCVCNPGFVSTGGGCEPSLPGDPAQHTEQEVCDQWNQGHSLTDPSPWSAGPSQCDPGTLTRAGIDDTLVRINLFRWLVGLGPVSDSTTLNEMDMWCAVVAAWNPPGGGNNPHSPDPSAKCYTQQGASGAGQSNIAWGSGHPAQAIDQFIQDNGNFTTFGHRRWIFNPPLGPVGIGYYGGGGPYGNAQCLAVFGSSGSGPSPDWIAFPPPGFVPTAIATWVWTFHHKSGVSSAEMSVVRQSDAESLAMEKMPLTGGYGSYPTVAFRPSGWQLAAGETYIVTVDGVGGGSITYEMKPVTCN